MRFKCRVTYEERVLEAEELKRWKPWFAWRPVMMPWGECVWLEPIERRYPAARVTIWPRPEMCRGEVVYRLTSTTS